MLRYLNNKLTASICFAKSSSGVYQMHDSTLKWQGGTSKMAKKTLKLQTGLR